MKVSILTPTYNDSESILETLQSVRNQTHKNIQHIIINDGSTDNTEKVIKDYMSKNKDLDILYIYQENGDQLNALLNGQQYVKGDFIYILHSDDLLPSNDFLENGIIELERSGADALIGDLNIINENGELVNNWKAAKYKNKPYYPVLVLLNNGSNIYGDVAIHRTAFFKDSVIRNYLIWNTPFWIDMENNCKTAKLYNSKKPILKYRIHQNNYAKNEIGKFNALNGELRAITSIAGAFNVPFIRVQSYIYQLLRKPGIRKLRLFEYYKPIYKNGKSINLTIYKIIKKSIINTYEDLENINDYLKSLLDYYKTDSNRQISIKTDDFTLYRGKDVRLFTKKLFTNQLDNGYYELIKEMHRGFGIINTDNVEKTKNICRFLNINPTIKGEL